MLIPKVPSGDKGYSSDKNHIISEFLKECLNKSFMKIPPLCESIGYVISAQDFMNYSDLRCYCTSNLSWVSNDIADSLGFFSKCDFAASNSD